MSGNKRIRIFAGPNGSGKTTLFESLKSKYPTGCFVNADDMEMQLRTSRMIDLRDYGLKATGEEFEEFRQTAEATGLIEKSTLYGKRIVIGCANDFLIDETGQTTGYDAAFCAAFVRYFLIKRRISFSCETVMSHPSKLEEIRKANREGYRTYLYFVCTEDKSINIERVASRVGKGRHNVSEDKIMSRYNRTLNNLAEALTLVYRAYLFDNSGKSLTLLAETYMGETLKYHRHRLPDWFTAHVTEKSDIIQIYSK
jgi:predicted ABC-type ATPase